MQLLARGVGTSDNSQALNHDRSLPEDVFTFAKRFVRGLTKRVLSKKSIHKDREHGMFCGP